MEKIKKYAAWGLSGAAYSTLAVLLSRLIIRSLGGIVIWTGRKQVLSDGLTEYIGQVLEQLQDAAIVSPWLAVILIGAVMGILSIRLCGRQKMQIAVSVCLWILLFIPLTLAVMWFTEVNDVQMGALLSSLLPLVSGL